MSLIFLVGMMGAGKTYWSQVWGTKYQCHVIDMDERIEQNEGQTISQIFEVQGEDAFRAIEQNTLREIIAIAQKDSDSPTAIVACGGGTPLFFDNMARMKKAGYVVYLQAAIQELMENLDKKTAHRPKLSGHVEERLTNLLRERRFGYEKADHIIPIKNITPTTFDEILKA